MSSAGQTPARCAPASQVIDTVGTPDRLCNDWLMQSSIRRKFYNVDTHYRLPPGQVTVVSRECDDMVLHVVGCVTCKDSTADFQVAAHAQAALAVCSTGRIRAAQERPVARMPDPSWASSGLPAQSQSPQEYHCATLPRAWASAWAKSAAQVLICGLVPSADPSEFTVERWRKKPAATLHQDSKQWHPLVAQARLVEVLRGLVSVGSGLAAQPGLPVLLALRQCGDDLVASPCAMQCLVPPDLAAQLAGARAAAGAKRARAAAEAPGSLAAVPLPRPLRSPAQAKRVVPISALRMPAPGQDHSVAIIIPFRDVAKQNRQAQLDTFVAEMQPWLSTHMPALGVTRWHVWAVEQDDDGYKFNRGKLLNIGMALAWRGLTAGALNALPTATQPLFKLRGTNPAATQFQHSGGSSAAENDLAHALYSADCSSLPDAVQPRASRFSTFVLHDVDLLPSASLAPAYAATDPLVHIANVWPRYSTHNPRYVGGILALGAQAMASSNGYPNHYWGWGGEDDETILRMHDAGLIPLAVQPGPGISIRDVEEEMLATPGSLRASTREKHGGVAAWRNNWKVEALQAWSLQWRGSGFAQADADVLEAREIGLGFSRVRVNIRPELSNGAVPLEDTVREFIPQQAKREAAKAKSRAAARAVKG